MTPAIEGPMTAAPLKMVELRAIDSLKFTLQADDALVTLFQTFRKKRSIGVYEAVGVIAQTDALEMLALARDLKGRTLAFLKQSHPHLLK